MTTRVLPTEDWPILADTELVIRPARSEDVPRLVEIGEEQLDELYPETPHDTSRIAPLAEAVMQSPEGSVQVAERGGLVVGMIAGLVVTQPITGHRVASELAWFVTKHDRGRIGMALLDAFEQWARAHGVGRIHMMSPPGRVETLYKRRGYRILEVTYEKQLRDRD